MSPEQAGTHWINLFSFINSISTTHKYLSELIKSDLLFPTDNRIIVVILLYCTTVVKGAIEEMLYKVIYLEIS